MAFGGCRRRPNPFPQGLEFYGGVFRHHSERWNWCRVPTVPIEIEHRRDFLNDGPGGEHVHIGKVDVIAVCEILRSDIAATDNCDLIVRRDRLVVHARIDATEVGEFCCARAANTERIEDSNLEIRVRVECGHAGVVTHSQYVVE